MYLQSTYLRSSSSRLLGESGWNREYREPLTSKRERERRIKTDRERERRIKTTRKKAVSQRKKEVREIEIGRKLSLIKFFKGLELLLSTL